jgi:hypothetical protein
MIVSRVMTADYCLFSLLLDRQQTRAERPEECHRYCHYLPLTITVLLDLYVANVRRKIIEK